MRRLELRRSFRRLAKAKKNGSLKLIFIVEMPLLGVHRDAGVVAHMLVGAGRHVEIEGRGVIVGCAVLRPHQGRAAGCGPAEDDWP